MYPIERSKLFLHHSDAPWSQRDGSVMRLEERIQELCAQAVAEKDPEKLAQILSELTASLREHRHETETMLFLHRKLFTDIA